MHHIERKLAININSTCSQSFSVTQKIMHSQLYVDWLYANIGSFNSQRKLLLSLKEITGRLTSWRVLCTVFCFWCISAVPFYGTGRSCAVGLHVVK